MRIQDRPLGYIPPEPQEEEPAEQVVKTPLEVTMDAKELQGSLAEGLESAVPNLPTDAADQLAGGLDFGD